MASTSTASSTQWTPDAPVRSRWKLAAGVAALLLLAAAFVFYEHPLWVADQGVYLRLKLAGIDSRYVEVGPYRVHYFVGGQGQPLLLIHGLGARSEDWAPEMPGYARRGFRVYAIDLLGSGHTSHPDIAYSIQQQVDLVQGFLNALRLQQVDLAGWSMGGWVALDFTAEHPERVSRLVVMDSAGLRFQTTFAPSIFTPKNRRQLAQLTAVLTPNPVAVPGFVDRAVLRRLSRNYWVVNRMLQSMLTGKDLMEGRLQQIHVPVLIVWGAQDTLIPPSVGERMHRDMPQSVLEEYGGCGHIAPATCAQRIVPRVADFFRSNPPMAGGEFRY
jgi:pimeloyl-ACP methyl ester carboxylesterase